MTGAARRPGTRRRIITGVLAALVDAVAVLCFVAIGRRSHQEEGPFWRETLSIAAPYLVAGAIGWVVLLVWRRPLGIWAGIAVWLAVSVGGSLTRRWVFDRSTAMPFVIVTVAMLLVVINGWRWLARRWFAS